MKPRTPIFASDVTAARLLDLRTNQFMDLVKQGHLPPGREIAPGCASLGHRRPSANIKWR